MQPRNLATLFFLATINLLGGTAAKVLALNNRSSIPPSQLSQATHLRGRINTSNWRLCLFPCQRRHDVDSKMSNTRVIDRASE